MTEVEYKTEIGKADTFISKSLVSDFYDHYVRRIYVKRSKPIELYKKNRRSKTFSVIMERNFNKWNTNYIAE